MRNFRFHVPRYDEPTPSKRLRMADYRYDPDWRPKVCLQTHSMKPPEDRQDPRLPVELFDQVITHVFDDIIMWPENNVNCWTVKAARILQLVLISKATRDRLYRLMTLELEHQRHRRNVMREDYCTHAKLLHDKDWRTGKPEIACEKCLDYPRNMELACQKVSHLTALKGALDRARAFKDI